MRVQSKVTNKFYIVDEIVKTKTLGTQYLIQGQLWNPDRFIDVTDMVYEKQQILNIIDQIDTSVKSDLALSDNEYNINNIKYLLFKQKDIYLKKGATADFIYTFNIKRRKEEKING